MCINRKNEHIIKCHSFSNEIKIFRQKLIKTKKVEKNRIIFTKRVDGKEVEWYIKWAFTEKGM